MSLFKIRLTFQVRGKYCITDWRLLIYYWELSKIKIIHLGISLGNIQSDHYLEFYWV